MRILIVDDDQATNLCLCRALSPLGETLGVSDGRQALDAFAQAQAEGEPFELVCMDLHMPRMDGQEALLKLRELEAQFLVPPGQESRVVVISAHADTAGVCQAYFKGRADGFVRKPLRLEELRAELAQLGFTVM